jgi:septal ring factor EnvC (AmiA/AmiB activator)
MANDASPGTDADAGASAHQNELAELRAELAALRLELQRQREHADTLRQQRDALMERQSEFERTLAEAVAHAAPEPPTEEGLTHVLDRWHRRLGTGPKVHLHEDFDDPLPEFEGY